MANIKAGLSSIAGTLGNVGQGPMTSGAGGQSQSAAVAAGRQVANRIADAVNRKDGYTDDAGMSDTIHSKKHTKKSSHKKNTHKKGARK